MHSLTVLLFREKSSAVTVITLKCDTVIRGEREHDDKMIDLTQSNTLKNSVFRLVLIIVICVILTRESRVFLLIRSCELFLYSYGWIYSSNNICIQFESYIWTIDKCKSNIHSPSLSLHLAIPLARLSRLENKNRRERVGVLGKEIM